MNKDYKLITTERAARPRSARRQSTSTAGVITATNKTSAGGGNGCDCDGHSHDNKTALDAIGIDDDGYGYITRAVDTTDPDTGETNTQSVTEKVKAGYADKAHTADIAKDLTPDSPVRDEFISKKHNDRTPYDLAVGGDFKAERGAQFGAAFAPGVDGFGGLIDGKGDGWLGGLHLRDFLEAPEYRFNRVEVLVGNGWRAPGGGIIESVTPDTDANGDALPTGTIKLKLEDGEYGAVAVDDICQGIFHDALTPANNATVDTDDGRGNFTFAGFYTVYFRVTSIIDTVNNSEFRYALRPVSSRWQYSFHPAEQMHFVGYGNITDKERQTSRYSTRTYERYLKDVDTWEFTEANIAAQFGALDNLNVFGLTMSGYSAYLNNIYMSGHLEEIELLPLRMEIDTEGYMPIAWGETLRVSCTVWRGWEDVTAKVTRWEVTRDTGIPQDDAVWALKPKVKAFAGSIDICLTAAENDLGNPPQGVTTLYTFTAYIDGEEQPVTQEMAVG